MSTLCKFSLYYPSWVDTEPCIKYFDTADDLKKDPRIRDRLYRDDKLMPLYVYKDFKPDRDYSGLLYRYVFHETKLYDGKTEYIIAGWVTATNEFALYVGLTALGVTAKVW